MLFFFFIRTFLPSLSFLLKLSLPFIFFLIISCDLNRFLFWHYFSFVHILIFLSSYFFIWSLFNVFVDSSNNHRDGNLFLEGDLKWKSVDFLECCLWLKQKKDRLTFNSIWSRHQPISGLVTNRPKFLVTRWNDFNLQALRIRQPFGHRE